jgi:hypothetical protein
VRVSVSWSGGFSPAGTFGRCRERVRLTDSPVFCVEVELEEGRRSKKRKGEKVKVMSNIMHRMGRSRGQKSEKSESRQQLRDEMGSNSW